MLRRDEALELIYSKLKEDTTLNKRTNMTPEHIIELLKLCIENAYFLFNKIIHTQINGLTIGAASSGFAADIFMEAIETRALSTFTDPPSIWKRYVDDTFVKISKQVISTFLIHLNTLHPRIKFTTEEMANQKIAFLDTEINVMDDGKLKFKIYRKPTHTDQYLHFTSNHHISQKLGIISTFHNRINNLITDEDDKKVEKSRVEKKLKNCGYPNWAFKKRKRSRKEKDEKNHPVITIPYVKNVSEKIARSYRKHGLRVVHKPSSTLKSTICKLKDPIHKLERPGANYHIKCKIHEGDSYIGETERTMKYRGYEHGIINHNEIHKNLTIGEKEVVREENEEGNTQIRRSNRLQRKEKINYKKMNEGEKLPPLNENSEVAQHMRLGIHTKEDMEINILGYEQNWWKRGIKEAIHIRKHKPTLNKDQGRYNLGQIWTKLIENKGRVAVTNNDDVIGRNLTEEERNFPNITTDDDLPHGGRN